MTGTQHCCRTMEREIERREFGIVYTPAYREYEFRVRGRPFIAQQLFYCPFCGKKLPRSRRGEWLERLGRVGAGLPPSDPTKDPSVPVAYRTDAWWRKRSRRAPATAKRGRRRPRHGPERLAADGPG